MKLLLDTCVSGGAKVYLEGLGHDVVWTGDDAADPGDAQILARAFAEERVLITLDKDFGEMAVHRGREHHGILRLVGFQSAQQGAAAESALKTHGVDLEAGALVTAEPGRLRIRKPTLPEGGEGT